MTEAGFWRKGFVFLLAGLVFGGIGISFFASGLDSLAANFDLANWNKVEAKIESVTIKPWFVKNSRAGECIIATYTFFYNKQKFTANQVALDPTFGGSPEDLIAARDSLKDSVENKAQISALVDPDKPENSVLFAPAPYKAYAFTGLGFFLSCIAVILVLWFARLFIADQKREERIKQFQDKPWLWEEIWQDFVISSEGTIKKIMPIFVFSMLVWLASLVLVAVILMQSGKGAEEYFAIGAILLIDFIFALHCRKKWRGERWADKVSLVASGYPAVPGKTWKFRVVVENPRDIEVVSGLKIFLRLHQTSGFAGVGGGEALGRDLLEENSSTCFCLNPDLQTDEKTMSFELEASIPENAENTALGIEFEKKWQVVLFFESARKEFIETFEIPVYSEDKFGQPDLNRNF